MRIAVISDVHGNSVALKEVLLDAKRNGVEMYIFSGDLVNDLPFGNETLELMKNVTDLIIEGNKEEYLKEYNRAHYTWKNIQFQNTVFMYNELTKENLNLVCNLPEKLSIEIFGTSLKIVHGSPKSVVEQIHEKDKELIDKYAKELQEDALIFGHTHEPAWYKNVNGKIIANAGCMGVSPYYKAEAEYIILHIKNKKIEVEKRLVPYSTDEVKEKIRKCGILDADKVLMNLTYLSLIGKGRIREEFFAEAVSEMKKLNHNLYKPDAQGIYKYFKLCDDEIWLKLYDKYKKYFEL